MRSHWTPLLALAVLGFALYADALQAPFLFDDNDAILRNRSIRTLGASLLEIPDQLPVSGRPLVSFSLAVNYALGGYDPWGYHLFNMLLHLANACLVFVVLRRALCTSRRSESQAGAVAWVAATIWAAHPLASEAVVYVMQRTELLVSFFSLGALAAAQQGWQEPRQRGLWHGGAVLCVFGAALCKEVAVVIPPLLWLYDRAFVSQTFGGAWLRHRPLHAGAFASWVLVAWMVLQTPRSGSVGWGLGVTSLEYLQTQAGVLLWYLRTCFVPTGLSIAHDWPIARDTAQVLPELVVMSLLFAGALLAVARMPRLGFAGMCFFAWLAPSSSIVPIVTEVAAERRMYLPLLVVVVPCVVLAHRALYALVRVERGRMVLGIAASVGVAGGLAMATEARVRDYSSLVSIWEDAVAVNPDASTARNNLGFAYDNAKRFDEARAQFEAAVRLDPEDASPRLNLGKSLAMAGDFAGAQRELEAARELEAESVAPVLALGNLAYVRGDYDVAIVWFQQAVAMRPDSFDVHYNLAVALEQVGRRAEARQHMNRAGEIDPERLQSQIGKGS